MELLDEAGDAFDGGLDLLQGGGEATTEESFATGPEGAAGHTRYFFLMEQAHCKLPGVEACGSDVRESIERSSR